MCGRGVGRRPFPVLIHRELEVGAGVCEDSRIGGLITLPCGIVGILDRRCGGNQGVVFDPQFTGGSYARGARRGDGGEQ
jgi:hypothetical protein